MNKASLDLTVLYAEDEDVVRKKTATFLRRYVNSVLEAEDGKQAFELLCSSKVDILVTDIRMPNMDGLQLARECKKIHPKLPIVLITAHNDTEYLQEAIDIGVFGFLGKPLDFEKFLSMLTDIDETKRRLAKAAEQEFLLTEYVGAINASYIVSKTDVQGIITFINDRFCEISGYTREELLGKSHNIVNHPMMPKSVFKQMWETIKCKETWRGRITNRKKDGSSYIVDSTVIPILDADSNIKEFISIRQDVTEMVSQRKQLAREKEGRQEDQSRHTAEVAKTKDSLLSVFTHELRTPLNAIINFTAVAAKRVQDNDASKRAQALEYLQYVAQSAAKMLDMINNILEIAKLRLDNVVVKRSVFELCEFLESFKSIHIQDQSKTVQIECSGVLQIETDPECFKKMINELVSNALKHAKTNVKIGCFSDARGVGISVEDDGCGIKDKNRVFELFYQEDESYLTRQSTGMGTGLYIVQKYSQILGLQIYVEDSALGGTKFSIWQKMTE